MAEVDKVKAAEATEALKRAKAEVDKDPDRFAGSPEDGLEVVLEVHATCVRALTSINPDLHSLVLESVARFLCISVEPSITQSMDLLADGIIRMIKGMRSPTSGPEFIQDQGTEDIVGLLEKMMKYFPSEQASKLREAVLSLGQEAFGPCPHGFGPHPSPSSEASPSDPSPAP
jgi:hypothetical protein